MDNTEYGIDCEEIRDDIMCRKVREDNKRCLEVFKCEIEESGLSPKTIKTHLRNVDFFINEYLSIEPLPVNIGTYLIHVFLGKFLIKECKWSTPNNIKTTAASIKKFYKCMLDIREIKEWQYESLCEIIKSDMEEWKEECRRFNSLEQVKIYDNDDNDHSIGKSQQVI